MLLSHKGNALTMDPARILIDATLTLGGSRFVYTHFHGIVTQEWHRLSHLLYGSYGSYGSYM